MLNFFTPLQRSLPMKRGTCSSSACDAVERGADAFSFFHSAWYSAGIITCESIHHLALEATWTDQPPPDKFGIEFFNVANTFPFA